ARRRIARSASEMLSAPPRSCTCIAVRSRKRLAHTDLPSARVTLPLDRRLRALGGRRRSRWITTSVMPAVFLLSWRRRCRCGQRRPASRPPANVRGRPYFDAASTCEGGRTPRLAPSRSWCGGESVTRQAEPRILRFHPFHGLKRGLYGRNQSTYRQL